MSTIINRPVLKEKYDNYINGKWTTPSTGQYFEVLSPLDGKIMSCRRSSPFSINVYVNNYQPSCIKRKIRQLH
jgi:aldehyde dehydrogenase